MRPRTAKRIAQVCAIIAVVMLIYFTLTVITGCTPRPIVTPGPDPTPGMPGFPSIPTPPPPGPEPTLAIFTWASIPFLIGGGIWWVITRTWHALALGVIFALIPWGAYWLAQQMSQPLQWALWASVALGVGFVILKAGRLLGWWEWDRKANEAARKLIKVDLKAATNDYDAQKVRRTAELMDQIGQSTFDPSKVQAP